MKNNEYLYIIPSVDKPIKFVLEGISIEDNGDMTFTIKRPATLSEIADMFDMTIDKVLNTKFGICTVDEEDTQNDERTSLYKRII